jgi:hypothetical protein
MDLLKKYPFSKSKKTGVPNLKANLKNSSAIDFFNFCVLNKVTYVIKRTNLFLLAVEKDKEDHSEMNNFGFRTYYSPH